MDECPNWHTQTDPTLVTTEEDVFYLLTRQFPIPPSILSLENFQPTNLMANKICLEPNVSIPIYPFHSFIHLDIIGNYFHVKLLSMLFYLFFFYAIRFILFPFSFPL